MVEKIYVEQFDNDFIYEIGTKIVEYAKKHHLVIATEIGKVNYIVFKYQFEGTTSDNSDWMRRKRNAVLAFEKSSLSIRRMLEANSISLKDPFNYPEKDYIAHGGCIPVFVKNVGMVGTITVSGLKDTDDHQLILDALEGFYQLA